MQSVGIIPARYASSRFEGKALADLFGKPMVQHVYERACRAQTLDKVIVATDDRRIYDAVTEFGGNVEMTGECDTGTERVAVVADRLKCDIIANIQGDEPLLKPEQIDLMIQPFLNKPEVQVCTLKRFSITEILTLSRLLQISAAMRYTFRVQLCLAELVKPNYTNFLCIGMSGCTLTGENSSSPLQTGREHLMNSLKGSSSYAFWKMGSLFMSSKRRPRLSGSMCLPIWNA